MTISANERISNLESGMVSVANALYNIPTPSNTRDVADELRLSIDNLRTRLQSALYNLDIAYHTLRRVSGE